MMAQGITMRFPAGEYFLWGDQLAETLLGQHTFVDAPQFGHDGQVEMEIVAAELADDKRSLTLKLQPV